MAGPVARKSFLERCTAALVPSNWGIRSNWAKIPLTIVSPIWVGPGALCCYAAHEVLHLGHIPDIARGTQTLHDTRIVPGAGGLPTLRGPGTDRSSTGALTPAPGFQAARVVGAVGAVGFQRGTADGAGAFGAPAATPFGIGIGAPGREAEFRPRLRSEISRAGGLAAFDTRLNVPRISGGTGGAFPGDDLRPVLRPTNFYTGRLANFDTRLTVPPLGAGSVPTSFGAGGLANFNTQLNVPGLTPFPGH